MPRTTVADRLVGIIRDVADFEPPVRLRAWDGSVTGPADAPIVVVRNRRALRRLAWAPGELGLARAFVSGDLDVLGARGERGGAVIEDGLRRVWAAVRTDGARPPTKLSAVRALSQAVALGAIGPAPRPPLAEARLSGRRHTRRRDTAAISHHYDLSNDFYRLFLDPTMAYSCAYYPTTPDGADGAAQDGAYGAVQDGANGAAAGLESTSPERDLAAAQRAKLDLICRKLELRPGATLLDVGCGWGSLILHAAEHYGVVATGITLSEQQHDEISKRVADRGLTDRVQVRLQHYRDVAADPSFIPGSYDAVSSVEMGEHVGQEHYPVYAGLLYAALAPGGRLLLQQMSRRHDTPPGGGSFIEAYVAPDMHMRPLPASLAFLEQAGFEIRHVEAMREHYVSTVHDWLARFEANRDEAVRLVGEESVRVWELYLAGGALAFAENRMGVDQVLARKSAVARARTVPR